MKRWWGVSLFLLPGLIVLAGAAFLGLTESGFRQLAGIAVEVSGGALAIDGVQGRLAGKWRLDGLRVQAPAADLRCENVVGQWQPLALLQGTVRMVTVHAEGVDVRIKEEAQGDFSLVLPEILLPVGVVLDTLALKDVFIHGIAGVELPRFERISLSLAAAKDSVLLKGVEVISSGNSLHLQGSLVLADKWPLDLRGSWRLDEKDAGPWAADFVIRGVLTDLLAQVDLQSPVKTRVYLSCSDIFGQLRWQAKTSLSELRLGEIDPDLSGLILADIDLRASGTTTGYQGTAQLKGGWVQFPQAPFHAEFTGDLTGLRVSSLAAQLPPGADQERLAGAVTARGLLDWQDGLRWQVELEAKNFNPEPYFSDWQGHVNARINTSGWVQGDAFSSETQLLSLDGDLLGYPVAGSGSVIVDGSGVEVQDLLLRSGDSELAVTGTVAAGVTAGHGRSSIAGAHAGAGATSATDLRVRFDTANLGTLLPEAGGVAHLRGSVQGSRKAPEFSFELDGEALSYQSFFLQTVTGSGQGTFSPQGELEVKLAGKGLHAGTEVFTSVALELGGNVARHQVQAELTGPAGDINAVVAGGFEAAANRNESRCRELLTGQSWQGEIRDFVAHLDPYGDWKLQGPAPMRIDGEGVELASFCLEQGEARLCLQGGWQPSGNGQGQPGAVGARDDGNGQWQLNADLDSFACSLLYQWRVLSNPVEGRLAAFVRTTGVGARLVSMEGNLAVPELQIGVQDEDGREQFLRWTDTVLNLQLVDDTLVGMAKTRFQEGSAMDATINVGQFGDLSASWAGLPLQGEIGLDVKDLASLAVFSNYTVKPTGSMQGTFAVSGRVGNPRLSGELRQIEGNVFIPATGITLEGLLLSVMVTGEGEGMHLILDAVSGPGKIRIAGDLSREDQGGWLVDAMAAGKEFEVAHLPDYQILVDPELHLVVREGVMEFSGKVLVPKASVTIKDIDGSVAASGDVVVIDGGEEGGRKDLPLRGSILVELGPEVSVDAFGLKGQLLGSVTVSDAPGLPLTGKGSLTVHEGTFVVNNRALDISRGRFFFLGGPLDNPGIDVLAQRKIKNKTVGVVASGTVMDMDLKLFSDPPMAEDAILTELLAGRSSSGTSHQIGSMAGAVVSGMGLERGGTFVENIISRLEDQVSLSDIYVESGDASSDVSVMIGKDLSKDLYISYGYDPFTAAGIFKARYDLWKGFSVETEVGADKTGADLLWSIEK